MTPAAPTAARIWNDLDILAGPFRERVLLLVERMTALGFVPRVQETYRSPERAAMLVRTGRSKARGGQSMHCYGVAADLICAKHMWDCGKHGCKFFDTMGEQAELCGLVWGGRWPSLVDKPHVQGVPLAKQDAIRAAKTAKEREAILLASLRPVVT